MLFDFPPSFRTITGSHSLYPLIDEAYTSVYAESRLCFEPRADECVERVQMCTRQLIDANADANMFVALSLTQCPVS